MESLDTLFQNQNLAIGLKVAGSLAGGLYVIHLYRKYVNPIAVGLILYPLLRKYEHTSLRQFLTTEYRANLELNYGKKPVPGRVADSSARARTSPHQ